jgi:cation diffusion facilitator family transporter
MAKAESLEGIISIIINTILFGVKMWAGIVSDSIALTADAWHTLSDSLTSLALIISIRLASKKADKEHPFGHGRWEPIGALFISFLLAVIGYDFFKDSIIRLSVKEAANFGFIAIVVTIASIIAKEAMAQYAFHIARKTKSSGVKADGWHHRSDALSSLIVLIGIIFGGSFWQLDAVLGIVISLVLFYAAFSIAKDTIGKLLGEKPGDALKAQIIEAAKSVYEGDLGLHNFHIHDYISHKELTFHIKLDNDLSLAEGHKIATNIENAINKKLSLSATAHVEPMYRQKIWVDKNVPN